METYIYMVRHGESPKIEGNERTRGLTEKGERDAKRVTELLENEGIDAYFSSPYLRAVLTIEELATIAGKEILVYEDLKELVFSRNDTIIPDHELYPLVDAMFSDRELRSPGGESIMECQIRAVTILKDLIKEYSGQKIVIGTHGLIMTLMLEHFDSNYGYDFLMRCSKPDVYKLIFRDEELKGIERVWGSNSMSKS